MRARPPLWLASAAMASFWAAVYTVARWTLLYALGPVHQDFRFTYVAAEAGVRHGWQSIYDPAVLGSLSAGFPVGEQVIQGALTYVNPPLLAWIVSPLTVFSEPVAFAIWTAFSVATFVVAWLTAAPYTGLARVVLLMVGLGLWPLLFVLYFGQPDLVLMALVAAAWWFCTRGRPTAAGVALAFATFLKPNVIWLVPIALLASRRYRIFGSWGVTCSILGAATAISLGEPGLLSWWHAFQAAQTDPAQVPDTIVRFFGIGPLTVVLWILQTCAALLVAVRDRRPEIVFAVGLLGSATASVHFHYWDYTLLVLGAWFVLRTAPPMWHRIWLALGILPMQLMSFQASHAEIPLIAPQLVWDAAWLAILVAGTFGAMSRQAARSSQPQPEPG